MTDHPIDRLIERMQALDSIVCAGFDPHEDLLPPVLRTISDPVDAWRRFFAGILEALAGVVPAVKPQIAFFEALGPSGIALYFELIREAHRRGFVVIGDIKRADIGTTAAAYARAHLQATDGTAADLVTVNPYLGRDGVQPFLDVGRPLGRGVVALVRTSNPSRVDLQDLPVDGRPLYAHVGRLAEAWGGDRVGQFGFGDVAAVVGATGPEEGARLRVALPHTFFLIPGYGAQGGTAADVARILQGRPASALVASSRAILAAWRRDPARSAQFAALARAEAVAMTADLRAALRDGPTGGG